MKLKNINNIEIRESFLTEEEFSDIRTFIIEGDAKPIPSKDVKLDDDINRMFDRWGIPDDAKRVELKVLAQKLYHYRLKTKTSRIFWRVLKENISNII